MARFLSREWFDEVARLTAPGSAEAGASADQEPQASARGDTGATGDVGDARDPGDDRLVLEQVVLGTPDGEVRYRVVVHDGRARLLPPPPPPGTSAEVGLANGTSATWEESSPADLTFTCDWDTATAMAQGVLPAQTALMEGRLRVKGNVSRISRPAQQLVGLDPVPEEIRRRTSY